MSRTVHKGPQTCQILLLPVAKPEPSRREPCLKINLQDHKIGILYLLPDQWKLCWVSMHALLCHSKAQLVAIKLPCLQVM